MSRSTRNLLDKRFGHLEVIDEAPYRVYVSGLRHKAWLCQCACGKRISITENALIAGGQKSCGCKRYGRFTRRRIGSTRYVYIWKTTNDLWWKNHKLPTSAKKMGGAYVLEHREIMEKIIGRKLKSYETVHHIDGNRANNRKSNLQLRHNSHGPGQVYQCNSCNSYDIKAIKISEI